MSTLPTPGSRAFSFVLRDAAGDPCVFGPEGPAAPATLLFFFKHDCATCELTAPLVERVHRSLAGSGLRVLGVSQDDAALTTAFAERHGLTLPRALDDELLVSAEYGFDAVPALVLVDRDANVLASFEGFGKADLQTLVGPRGPAVRRRRAGDRARGRDCCPTRGRGAARRSTIRTWPAGSRPAATPRSLPRAGSACRPTSIPSSSSTSRD